MKIEERYVLVLYTRTYCVSTQVLLTVMDYNVLSIIFLKYSRLNLNGSGTGGAVTGTGGAVCKGTTPSVEQ
jgi:hypothetical protein